MGVPTQVAGLAAETPAAALAAGFFGWSPEPDRRPFQVTGGPYKGTYPAPTPLSVGDVVSVSGVTFRALSAGVAAPTVAAPTTATTGGAFTAGTFYWKVTSLTASGESAGSNEVSVAVAVSGTATVTWGAVTGATGYKVYRAMVAGGESTSPALVATLGAVTSFTDTGAAVAAGAVPAGNTTVPAPAIGPSWADATSHRSIAEVTAIGVRKPDFYR